MEMEARRSAAARKNTPALCFRGGMQGTIPRQMLLSCPWDKAFSLYYALGPAFLKEGGSYWQLPAEGAVLVRSGQTPVLRTQGCPLRILYLIVGGENPLPVKSGNTAVFVPRKSGSRLPAELFSTVLNRLPGEEEDAVLQEFLTRFMAETRLLPPSGTRPPDSICLLKQIFDTRYAEKLTLDSLAGELHWNKYKLEKDFKKYFGRSPFDYLLNVRVKAACRMLRETGGSIVHIGLAVGIENTSYFIRIFKRRTGMSPLEYRTHYAARVPGREPPACPPSAR